MTQPRKIRNQAQHVNRLVRESSPYLLQHAHNPVDWYPWGDEAFAKAKKEGKLVFLSIGYSSCHWCHVMERESFDNPTVAKLLNDRFVCIKVDREERPDIDTIYMTALNVLEPARRLAAVDVPDGRRQADRRRHLLAAEDKEIDGDKVPGFKSVLNAVAHLESEKPKQVEDQADRVAAATVAVLAEHRFVAVR